LEALGVQAEWPVAVIATACNAFMLATGEHRQPMVVGGGKLGLLALPNWRENKHLFCVGFVVRISKVATQWRRNNFLFT